jgi:hypothetical protein
VWLGDEWSTRPLLTHAAALTKQLLALRDSLLYFRALEHHL